MVFVFLFRYLSDLLAERHKLGPFMPVLPHTYQLLNQGESFEIAIFFPKDNAEKYLPPFLMSLKQQLKANINC